MKKWLAMLTVIMLAATFIPHGTKAAEKTIRLKQGEQLVLPNKQFTLTFLEALNRKTVTNKTISVVTSKKVAVKANIRVSTNGKKVLVTPPSTGYKVNESYTLSVKKGLKTVAGKDVNLELTVPFRVVKSAQRITSRTELARLFNNALSTSSPMVMYDMMKATETASVGNDGSKTNVQVNGVDEADIVKTDGNFIYRVVNQAISIVDVKQLKVVATIPIPEDTYINQLYIEGTQLIALGQRYGSRATGEPEVLDAKIGFMPMAQKSVVQVYDVANAATPTFVRSFDVDGYALSSRKVNNKLYLIANYQPFFWLYRNTLAEKADFRPTYSDSASKLTDAPIGFANLYALPNVSPESFMTIATMDLKDMAKPVQMKTMAINGDVVYMSKNNLYIAASVWPEYAFGDGAYYENVNTVVQKFSVTGDSIEFAGTGEVPGTAINQFALDEANGQFRIATTSHNWVNPELQTNQMFIFNDKMERIGALTNIAPGENMYAVRYMGDRAYVVTFKQVDPLFVIDLKDGANPKVLGELKVPGFSTYLHPVDETHVIGFGQDTTTKPNPDGGEPLTITNGLKLSLFDVTNPLVPKEVAAELIPGRFNYSELLYDHKALYDNSAKKLIGFPVTLYQLKANAENEYDTEFKFQGGFVYEYDVTKGFKKVFEMTHYDMTKPVDEQWEHSIGRLLSIGDTLFTFSNAKIVAYSLKDFKQIAEIK